MKYDYDYDGSFGGKKGLFVRVVITVVEIIAVVAAAFLIVRFGLETMNVSGSNMEPTLNDGENILINKMSYKLHSVKRNDVVVVRQNGSEHNYYVIQRVIGLPGEKIKISNAMLFQILKIISAGSAYCFLFSHGIALMPNHERI